VGTYSSIEYTVYILYSIVYTVQYCILTSSLVVHKMKYDVILLDIEGTTTPISFVHDTLFPYVRSHVSSYLQENYQQQQTIQDIRDLLKLNQQEREKQVTTQTYAYINTYR